MQQILSLPSRLLRRLGAGRLRAAHPFDQSPVIWPTLEDEIGEDRVCLKGRVLNAGAGCRGIDHLVEGVVTNQDIPGGRHNENIHVLAPLHEIPRPDGFFDTVFCNAVLEHVPNPEAVVAEFWRVLKPGGYLYLAVPFLQPEHLDPEDYQRYTKDGLSLLVRRHGFTVIRVQGLNSVYHTLGWILHEWLTSRDSVSSWLLRLLLYPLIRRLTSRSRFCVERVASGYKLLAVKAT